MILEITYLGRYGAFRLVPLVKVWRNLRKRVATTPDGQVCQSGLLAQSGRVLSPGTLALNYQDPDGNTVNHGHWTVTDNRGNPLRVLPSTLGRAQSVQGPVSPETLVEHVITKAYWLDPLTSVEELSAALESGHIFKVPFHPKVSWRNRPAFLIGNGDGCFLLQAEPCRIDFVDAGFRLTPEQAWEDPADDHEDEIYPGWSSW